MCVFDIGVLHKNLILNDYECKNNSIFITN